MDKTTQDLAWRVLPAEYREEVKKIYNHNPGAKPMPENTSRGKAILRDIFGHDNLTSDAEGEEILTCKKDQAVKLYDIADRAYAISGDKWYQGYMKAMIDLFGSKCLPDEKEIAENANCSNVESPEANVDSLDGNVESLEPEPDEPKYKFKEGDEVEFPTSADEDLLGTIAKRLPLEPAYIVVTEDGKGYTVFEHDLKPYTEPKNKDSEFIRAESVKESRIASEEPHLRNLSQESANCDKHFDNILKDSFSKERRLNIAAKMLQALVCAPIISGVDPNPPAEQLAQTAFRLADALIAECEKGGMK